MSKTARLGLPFIHSCQAQKEITHNEALTRLDALVNPVVQQISLTSPPKEAKAGDLYIIGDKADDKFEKHAGKIAVRLEHGWQFIDPPKWLEVTIDADGSRYRFDGKSWIPSSLQSTVAYEHPLTLPAVQKQPQMQPQANNILINKDTGEYLRIEHLQEDVIVKGAYVDSKIKIPHHSIVIAVSIRVLEIISGTGSFSMGVEGATNRYGNNLGVGKDTTNLGLTDHPLTYWYDTAVRLTADNGSFTGGLVRITAQLLKPHGPWNWD